MTCHDPHGRSSESSSTSPFHAEFDVLNVRQSFLSSTALSQNLVSAPASKILRALPQMSRADSSAFSASSASAKSEGDVGYSNSLRRLLNVLKRLNTPPNWATTTFSTVSWPRSAVGRIPWAASNAVHARRVAS